MTEDDLALLERLERELADALLLLRVIRSANTPGAERAEWVWDGRQLITLLPKRPPVE